MTSLNPFDGKHNSCAVIGAQWGDEGKGKLADILSEDADLVVRWQGGPNAGHTVKVDGEKYVTHSLPVGVLRENTTSIIAPGCVVDIEALGEEIEELGDAIKGDIFLSEDATIILPWHKRIDRLKDRSDDGGEVIGTTNRGIGPTYASRASRLALRVKDLFSDDVEAKLERLHNWAFARLKSDNMNGVDDDPEYHLSPLSDVLESVKSMRRILVENDIRIGSSRKRILEGLDSDEKVLFEGAQGTMLDLYHGTYPNVTSSSPTAGGIASGCGIPPGKVDNVIGVSKAYTTKVGEGGRFPCEEVISNEKRSILREKGDEYGATTGRPRRCGWLDLPALKYAHRINDFDYLFLTKLDVLSHVDEPEIVTNYDLPCEPEKDLNIQTEVKEGWDEDLTSVRKIIDLPLPADRFICRIKAELDISLLAVSVGPNREEIATLN